MITLTIKVKVKDKIDAYRLVNDINNEYEVSEITFKGQNFKFNKTTKKPKYLFNEKYIDEEGNEVVGELVLNE